MVGCEDNTACDTYLIGDGLCYSAYAYVILSCLAAWDAGATRLQGRPCGRAGIMGYKQLMYPDYEIFDFGTAEEDTVA